MARVIKSCLRIEGSLVAETPLHVGGYGDSPDTDLPLAQNGKGEWYMPGTSIAGVMRNWCEKNFREPAGEKMIRQLFGPRRQPGKEEGHASFVLIQDAVIEQADVVLREIRDGVGIDRFYGTAADGAKFDRAILPRGTKLAFTMSVDIGVNHISNQTKAVIANLVAALTQAKVRFGAAKTRGLGRVKLKNCTIKEESFNDFDAIIALLRGKNIAKPFASWLTEFESSLSATEKEALKKLKNQSPELTIDVHWRPRLPVMVKAGYDGIGVDILPLASGVSGTQLALVLPGSSIKGVLRSQAERIMRTLLPDCDCTRGKKFHEQIDAIPLVEQLFGACSKAREEDKQPTDNKKCKSNPKAKLGLGALAIDDCYAQKSCAMNADNWRSVEVAEVKEDESYTDWELWRRLRKIDEPDRKDDDIDFKEDTQRFKINHHVAIDRWTGGAAEGALFSVLAPEKIEWEAMRLSLDLDRISTDSRLPALMLLLLTLRDVEENRLPFGFATNRGLGEIEVKEITFDGTSLEEIGFTRKKGSFVELKEEVKREFPSEAWKEWQSRI